MFDQLPTESFELTLPNEEYPEYPIITQEKRIKFDPIYKALYAEARADGCIYIPFHETSPKKKPSYADVTDPAETRQAAQNNSSGV